MLARASKTEQARAPGLGVGLFFLRRAARCSVAPGIKSAEPCETGSPSPQTQCHPFAEVQSPTASNARAAQVPQFEADIHQYYGNPTQLNELTNALFPRSAS